MRQILLLLICAGLAAVPAKAEQMPADPDVHVAETWQPPAGMTQVPIWPEGAPDMKGVNQPPERHNYWTAFDVSTPTSRRLLIRAVATD